MTALHKLCKLLSLCQTVHLLNNNHKRGRGTWARRIWGQSRRPAVKLRETYGKQHKTLDSFLCFLTFPHIENMTPWLHLNVSGKITTECGGMDGCWTFTRIPCWRCSALITRRGSLLKVQTGGDRVPLGFYHKQWNEILELMSFNSQNVGFYTDPLVHLKHLNYWDFSSKYFEHFTISILIVMAFSSKEKLNITKLHWNRERNNPQHTQKGLKCITLRGTNIDFFFFFKLKLWEHRSFPSYLAFFRRT